MTALGDIQAARIDDRSIDLATLLHTMKITDRLGDFRHALDDLLIQQGAEREGIAPSDEELQAEADGVRVALGLHRAADTRAWLAARGVSVDDFETYVQRIVCARKLKARVATEHVEGYVMEHRPAFDAARISRLAFGSEAVAREAQAQLAARETSVAVLAGRFAADPAGAPADGAGFVLRMHMDPAVAAAVFRASPGEIVGPIATARGAHELVQAHEVRRAELDARTGALVQDLLFSAWLRGERERSGAALQVAELA